MAHLNFLGDRKDALKRRSLGAARSVLGRITLAPAITNAGELTDDDAARWLEKTGLDTLFSAGDVFKKSWHASDHMEALSQVCSAAFVDVCTGLSRTAACALKDGPREPEHITWREIELFLEGEPRRAVIVYQDGNRLSNDDLRRTLPANLARRLNAFVCVQSGSGAVLYHITRCQETAGRLAGALKKVADETDGDHFALAGPESPETEAVVEPRTVSESHRVPPEDAKLSLQRRYPHAIGETLRFDSEQQKNVVDCRCTQCGGIHTRATSDLFQCRLCAACNQQERRARNARKRQQIREILSALRLNASA